MTICFLTWRFPPKIIPTTANFHFEITLKILTKFYLTFLKKISDKSYPQKLYPWPGLNFTNKSLQNLKRNWDVLGIIFEGNFCHWIFFEKFGRDLFVKFSNTSSPQKLYSWCLNSTNKSLPKFEKKLRCLGYKFWIELLSPNFF